MKCIASLISVHIKINLLCLGRIQLGQELWPPKKGPRVPNGDGMEALGGGELPICGMLMYLSKDTFDANPSAP